jgi:hypothetical protein
VSFEQRVSFILSSKSGSCDAASVLASAKRVSQEKWSCCYSPKSQTLPHIGGGKYKLIGLHHSASDPSFVVVIGGLRLGDFTNTTQAPTKI